MLVLVKSELLGQFFNTLTVDYKYSSWNRDNFWEEVPRKISPKPKTFSDFFLYF